jgi:hypothetical protein
MRNDIGVKFAPKVASAARDREAYDAYVAAWPAEHRWQWWPVPWRLATPSEKAVKIVLWTGQGIAVSVCLAAIIFLDGMLIDNYGRMVERHDQCLKSSVTGFEAQECLRGKR